MLHWQDVTMFIQAATSIFAVVNPIGNLPIFVSLTEEATPQDRRKVLRLACMTALAILCAMAVAGKFLLQDFFHITLDEFAFGGGLMLVVVGIRTLLMTTTRENKAAAVDAKQRLSQHIRMAVSPIASPLLVGPGSVVTVMLIVNQHGVLYGLGASIAAFALVIAILNSSSLIYRLMGELGSLAVGRVMTIFIVAIGVHFIFQSVARVFSGLVR